MLKAVTKSQPTLAEWKQQVIVFGAQAMMHAQKIEASSSSEAWSDEQLLADIEALARYESAIKRTVSVLRQRQEDSNVAIAINEFAELVKFTAQRREFNNRILQNRLLSPEPSLKTGSV